MSGAARPLSFLPSEAGQSEQPGTPGRPPYLPVGSPGGATPPGPGAQGPACLAANRRTWAGRAVVGLGKQGSGPAMLPKPLAWPDSPDSARLDLPSCAPLAIPAARQRGGFIAACSTGSAAGSSPGCRNPATNPPPRRAPRRRGPRPCWS